MQIQDQENVHAIKSKSNVTVPTKRQGVGIRALGEVNSNIQGLRDVPVGKVVAATAEIEKKAVNRAALRR